MKKQGQKGKCKKSECDKARTERKLQNNGQGRKEKTDKHKKNRQDEEKNRG